MGKLKVMTIFGTRPEATKMAPVVKALKASAGAEPVVCVTAQHREMLDQVLETFNITPDFDLNIMQPGQTLSDIMARSLKGLEEVMAKSSPDIVLVHGDTSTTLAGGIAAYYSQIKIGHVEAGLRTYDKYQPFPEEMNRQLIGRLADLHFAPTALARENLLKENVPADKIYITGNTAVDCLSTTISADYSFVSKELNGVDFKGNRVIAMTAHRRENLDEPFENIFAAVRDIVDHNPDVFLVYPVHFNPLVRKQADKYFAGHPRILLTDPVEMNDMHNLMSRSYLILTDSGGIQEEAPSLNKPVVVLRNVTERPEGIAAGTLKLAGVKREDVYRITQTLLEDSDEYNKMAAAKNPFGDGHAAERIVEAILHSFNKGATRPPDYFPGM